MALTDQLLRDPKHPDVKADLEVRLRVVCQQLAALGAEKAQLLQLLERTQTRSDSRQAYEPRTHAPS